MAKTTFSVSFDKRVLKELEAFGNSKLRTAVTKAVNNTAAHFVKRLNKAIHEGGGMYGVPRFADRAEMSKALHKAAFRNARTASGRKKRAPKMQWGGRFAKQKGGMIKKWGGVSDESAGCTQFVGFPDQNKGLRAFATEIQTEETYTFSKKQRRMFYLRGLAKRLLSPLYKRVSRPIIAPFVKKNQGDFVKEARKVLAQALEKLSSETTRLSKSKGAR